MIVRSLSGWPLGPELERGTGFPTWPPSLSWTLPCPPLWPPHVNFHKAIAKTKVSLRLSLSQKPSRLPVAYKKKKIEIDFSPNVSTYYVPLINYLITLDFDYSFVEWNFKTTYYFRSFSIILWFSIIIMNIIDYRYSNALILLGTVQNSH